jgi:glutaredoxin
MRPEKLNLLLWSCLLLACLYHPTAVNSADVSVNIHLFSTQGCPHCRQAKEFLATLVTKYPQVSILEHELTQSEENQELLEKVARHLNVEVTGVPFIVIGDRHFIGFLGEATTGAAITAAVQQYLAGPYTDPVSNLASPSNRTAGPAENAVPDTVTLPIFGEIQTRKVSLPLFTLMMGAVDGFNPCAMWVLVFLIGLLLGMKDRWRMWILGSTFIAMSAGIYFLFMTAWLNLLMFLGLIFWVRLLVGVVALTAGYYNLKEYFSNQPGVCKVTNSARRQRVFQKLKAITQQQQFWLALGGIIMLAFMVNLVELICSASLPVVYLQVLTMNNLPVLHYYLYILLYIFIFMLDDLIVFIIAMTTLQVAGMTGQYSRLSHLLGGLAMLIVGLLIIVKPEWLMFG